MATPKPLPEDLLGRPLTPELMRRHGISPERLWRQDLQQVAHGIYLPRNHAGEVHLAAAVALSHALPSVCLSDATAAHYYGFDLPRGMAGETAIHVSRPRTPGYALRRAGVICHRRALTNTDVTVHDGTYVTTIARTWFDLTCSASLLEAVQLGDHLVRHPRARFEQRTQPWTTVTELEAVVNRVGRVPGKTRARRALELIRIGADSFPETALRLALVHAGLPEPQLQIRLNPRDRSSPVADAGYRRSQIVMQYDGESHFTLEQQRRDQLRDNHFTAAGWILLRFNAVDLRQGFAHAVAQVRRALADREAERTAPR